MNDDYEYDDDEINDWDDGWTDDSDVEEVPCPNCGAMIAEETQKCPVCGDWVIATSPAERFSKNTLIVVVVVLLVVALAGLLTCRL